MSATLIPPSTSPSPAPRVPAGVRPAPPPRRRRRGDRSRWRLGLALSLLFHLFLFLLLYYTVVRLPQTGAPPAARAGARPAPPGMQVVQLDEVAGPVPAAAPSTPAAAPRTRPRVTSAPAPGGRPGEAAPAAGAGAPTRRGIDALVPPKDVDTRLRVDPDAVTAPPTDQERLERRIAGKIQQYNDSVAAAVAAAQRSLDWTLHGKDGSRWGIAPDGIHLGKVTLPAPTLGGSAADRARQKEWNAIQDQAARAAVRDRFNERVKALHERKEKERAAKKKAGSGSGSGSDKGSGHGL